jgi:hypothetical protein
MLALRQTDSMKLRPSTALLFELTMHDIGVYRLLEILDRPTLAEVERWGISSTDLQVLEQNKLIERKRGRIHVIEGLAFLMRAQ